MLNSRTLTSGGIAGGVGVPGKRGAREEKDWDNCKSIVNEIKLKMISLLSILSDIDG